MRGRGMTWTVSPTMRRAILSKQYTLLGADLIGRVNYSREWAIYLTILAVWVVIITRNNNCCCGRYEATTQSTALELECLCTKTTRRHATSCQRPLKCSQSRP